jgi:hypothetical protein
MSTKHVRTAFDLVRFKLGLSVKCRSCGHLLTLAGHEVAREVGQMSLRELQPRLKCSVCSAKDVEMKLLHPTAPR